MQIIVPKAVGAHLVRADEELAALQTEVESYFSRRPYRARVERDPGHARRGRIILRIDERVPDRVAVGLSVCIENWRAALDTFVSIIARRHSGSTACSAFPIFVDADAFAGRTDGEGPAPGSGLYKIRGMKASAQAIIERLQPYNRGREGDPLWMLEELSSATNDGWAGPVWTVLEGSTYKVSDLEPTLIIRDVHFVAGPTRDKATIGHVVVNRWDRSLGRALTFDLACGLAFGNRTADVGPAVATNGRLINATTNTIRDAVWDTCWRLRFFTGRKGAATIESAAVSPVSLFSSGPLTS
jgi:hypothetical protein